MQRREALNLALRLDKAGVSFDRVYAFDQKAEGAGWFISCPEAPGHTIRNKKDAKQLLKERS